MRKGISEVIATILMLMITLSLAGTAYMYISGVFTARTGKIISLESADCISKSKHIFVIRNEGTQDIATPTAEVIVNIDGGNVDCDPGAGIGIACTSGSLAAGRVCIVECPNPAANIAQTAIGAHRIRVIGPSNVATGTDYCS